MVTLRVTPIVLSRNIILAQIIIRVELLVLVQMKFYSKRPTTIINNPKVSGAEQK